MSAPIPVVLILGSGPRIGMSVASKFVDSGYKVAVVSRKSTTTVKGAFAITADFANPDSIPAVFDAVNAKFDAFPSIVVYNAATLTPPPDAESVLSIPVENVEADLKVNVVSAYVAAQQAVKAWGTLPKEAKKSFIYTGNILNVSILPVPMMMNLGMGKSASAYWIGTADALYAAKGYRFFYADERYADGRNKGLALDGAAHAEFFAQLAEHDGKVPWHATFVKDQGYVCFK